MAICRFDKHRIRRSAFRTGVLGVRILMEAYLGYDVADRPLADCHCLEEETVPGVSSRIQLVLQSFAGYVALELT